MSCHLGGLLAAVCGLLIIATPVSAQQYPSRAVSIIVPYPAGGPVDLMARTLGQKLSDDWHQPVIILNRPGGNSAVGAIAAARANPDGYTLLVAMDTTLVYNLVAGNKVDYELKDFAPISMTTNNTPLLIAPANGPKSIKELIARAKAAPSKLNYGAAVFPSRIAGYLFNSLAGIKTTEILYRGSSEIVQGLLTGSIDYSFDGLSASLALIRDGKLRPLARLAVRPLSALPNLPNLNDDLPGFGNISIWSGIVAPAGTPSGIIETIQHSVADALATPEIIGRLDKVGISVVSSTPDEFQKFIRDETARATKIVKESGLTLE